MILVWLRLCRATLHSLKAATPKTIALQEGPSFEINNNFLEHLARADSLKRYLSFPHSCRWEERDNKETRKMSNAITSSPVQMNVPAARPQPVQPAAADSKAPQIKTAAPAAPHGDTVKISSAALQALQAMQEATESASQTAQEASHGDRAAQRLL